MSTADEYTPTTDEVRADYARSLTYPKFVSPIRARQFDRWLSALLEGERARARTEAVAPILEWIHHEPYEVSCERAKESVTTTTAEEPQIAFIDGYQRAVAHVAAMMTDHTDGG